MTKKLFFIYTIIGISFFLTGWITGIYFPRVVNQECDASLIWERDQSVGKIDLGDLKVNIDTFFVDIQNLIENDDYPTALGLLFQCDVNELVASNSKNNPRFLALSYSSDAPGGYLPGLGENYQDEHDLVIAVRDVPESRIWWNCARVFAKKYNTARLKSSKK